MSWFKAALRDEWDGLERISKDIRPADIVTMANALTGFVATYFAATGRITPACILILIAIILDGVDGAVARLTGGGPLGGFLDSLADFSSFAIAPAMVMLQWQNSPYEAALACAFIIAVMLRLARFEALRERPPTRYFSGMSSPGAALVIAAITLAALEPWMAWTLAIVSIFMMVSRIRYPKLRGIFGAIAVGTILVVLSFYGLGRDPYWAIMSMIGFMTIYLFAGPFYVLAKFGPTQ